MEKKEKNGEKENKELNNQNDSFFTKKRCIFLLYAFYLCAGLFNEKLAKNDYEYLDENNNKKILKFKYPAITLCFPSILSFCISSFMLNYMKKKYFNSNIESPILFRDKSIIGILHIVSSFTAQTALIYLDFIVKTIGKSCKSASIMFIYFLNTIPFCNKLLKKLLDNNTKEENKKEKILMKDVLKVLLTTTSVILFNLGSNNSDKEKNNEKNSYFGIVILLISLFSDGLLSLKEKMIKNNIMNDKKYENYNYLLSWEYMNIFSFFTFLFSFYKIISNLYLGNYKQIFKVIFSNYYLMKDLFCYAVFDVLGQTFLYIYLGKYGPLALSMVTSVRKIFSITLSIFYFGKCISIMQGIGLLFAIFIIFWENFEKGIKKNTEKEKTQ